MNPDSVSPLGFFRFLQTLYLKVKGQGSGAAEGPEVKQRLTHSLDLVLMGDFKP